MLRWVISPNKHSFYSRCGNITNSVIQNTSLQHTVWLFFIPVEGHPLPRSFDISKTK